MDLYINTIAVSKASALAQSLTSNAEASLPDLCFDDEVTINLIFSNGAGAVTTWSGSATYSVRVGIGTPGAAPTGGTFTLTGDLGTTAAIAYNATAAAVQSVLSAQVTGGCAVSGAWPDYIVTWSTYGNKALLTSEPSGLTPDGVITISELTAGAAATYERQLIHIARQPAALQTTWTPIVSPANGWTGNLDLGTSGILNLLGGATSVQATFEVEVTDASSKVQTYLQKSFTLRHEILDTGSVVSLPLASYLTATECRAQFVQNRTPITGLTGGTAAKLDSIVTAGIAVGWRVAFAHTGASADLEYVLEAGTTAEAAPWTIRPDDYAAATNEKIWKLKRIRKAGADCLWNSTSSKFHQIIAEEIGGVVTVSIDQTGFQITS